MNFHTRVCTKFQLAVRNVFGHLTNTVFNLFTVASVFNIFTKLFKIIFANLLFRSQKKSVPALFAWTMYLSTSIPMRIRDLFMEFKKGRSEK